MKTHRMKTFKVNRWEEDSGYLQTKTKEEGIAGKKIEIKELEKSIRRRNGSSPEPDFGLLGYNYRISCSA